MRANFTGKNWAYLYGLPFLMCCVLLTFDGLAQSKGAKVGNIVLTGTSGRRMALVLGNKTYQYANPLKNPVNDAKDVKAALVKLGFEVSEVIDADYRGTVSAINEFVAKLQAGDVVVFYYSGHGIGYNGKNYILPVDANINCIERIDEHGIPLGRILGDFQQKQSQACFLFLETSRNMPNLRACSNGQRALTTQGLVKPTNNPRGSMIVFATEEGTTAEDNLVGRNSLFTTELLKYLTFPGIGIRTILDRTAAGVEVQSNGRQSPARYDKLSGDFVFIEAATPPNIDPTKPAVVQPSTGTPSVLQSQTANLRGARTATETPPPAPASANIRAAHYYALIVAAQNYKDPNYRGLQEPLNDAQKLMNLLTTRYTFSPANVTLLKDPSRESLTAAFEKLLQTIGENDNLLIFYAGHGKYDEKLRQGYWLLSDAQYNNRGTWISNADIRDFVRGIGSKHTLLITDACFSGAIFRTRGLGASPVDSVIEEKYKYNSRKALTSGNLKEVPDQSVFMWYLLKRLEQNTNAYMSAGQIFYSLEDAVTNNSKTGQLPQFGAIMDAGDEGGDFIFVLKNGVH